jgi:release factor glutamine methyltransferase
LGKTETYLLDKGVDSPKLSAQRLLAQALGRDRRGLILAMDRPLTPAELDAVRPLVARRGRGEPVALILGTREFYGLDFAVTTDTLIPRPETEGLIDRAKELFPDSPPEAFADLGTGSGCLAVTLAVTFPQALGLALDLSPAALAVARQNAARHGVENRVSFFEGDFSRLPAREGGYALIVSTPPYVSAAEYRNAPGKCAISSPKAPWCRRDRLEAIPVLAATAFRAWPPVAGCSSRSAGARAGRSRHSDRSRLHRRGRAPRPGRPRPHRRRPAR